MTSLSNGKADDNNALTDSVNFSHASHLYDRRFSLPLRKSVRFLAVGVPAGKNFTPLSNTSWDEQQKLIEDAKTLAQSGRPARRNISAVPTISETCTISGSGVTLSRDRESCLLTDNHGCHWLPGNFSSDTRMRRAKRVLSVRRFLFRIGALFDAFADKPFALKNGFNRLQ